MKYFKSVDINEEEMNRVFYFNIDYFCNNKCIFCFSHNVSENKREISKEELFKRLDRQKLRDNDYIILNGGEPTIHSEFYQIVNEINKYNAVVKIYSNGVGIKVDKITNKNIEFIVPIHCVEEIHDELTRKKGSFKSTINSLKSLNENNIPFNLKFIVSNEMIEKKFDIHSFLIENQLKLKEIFISRMNLTKVAKQNGYKLSDNENEVKYIENQYKKLKGNYIIKFLDFSRCFLENLNLKDFDKVDIKEKEEFYFNDKERNMILENYYKERVEFDKCEECKFSEECDLISESYYILSANYKNEIRLVLE